MPVDPRIDGIFEDRLIGMNRKNFIGTMGLGASALLAPGCRKKQSGSSPLPDYDSVTPSSFWAEVRRGYVLDTDRVYLNCGGLGPAPSRVLKAVESKSPTIFLVTESMYEIKVTSYPFWN